MRRVIFILVLTSFAALGLALAGVGPQAEAPVATTVAAPETTVAPPTLDHAAACGPVDVFKMPEAERTEWLAKRGLKVDDPSERTIGPPPCPPFDGCASHPSCTGTTSCEETGVTSSYDTGYTSCQAPGGGLTCTNGGTIIAFTYSCAACPCCNYPLGQRCMCAPNCSVGHGFSCGDPS